MFSFLFQIKLFSENLKPFFMWFKFYVNNFFFKLKKYEKKTIYTWVKPRLFFLFSNVNNITSNLFIKNTYKFLPSSKLKSFTFLNSEIF